MMEIIEEIKETYNPELRMTGVLLTKYDNRTTLSSDTLDSIEEQRLPLFRTKFVSASILSARRLLDYRLISMPQIATLLKTMQRSQKNFFQLKLSHCGKSGAKWPKNKKTVWQSRERTGKNAKPRKPMPAFGNALSGNLQSPKKGSAQSV
jgi:hypothetical protein